MLAVVAVHLGVAGTVAATSDRTGWASGVVAGMVVLKLALVAWGLRRRASRNAGARGSS